MVLRSTEYNIQAANARKITNIFYNAGEDNKTLTESDSEIIERLQQEALSSSTSTPIIICIKNVFSKKGTKIINSIMADTSKKIIATTYLNSEIKSYGILWFRKAVVVYPVMIQYTVLDFDSYNRLLLDSLIAHFRRTDAIIWIKYLLSKGKFYDYISDKLKNIESINSIDLQKLIDSY